MSVAQRVIVRLGVEADVPSLQFGELGMDIDTLTMRIGDDTPDPPKILTTKSTGDFDFSSSGTITFNNVVFASGGGIGGVDIESLYTETGIVVSIGGGQFRQTTITSSDNSVVITNGDGQSGLIDLKVSSASIQNALGDINNQLTIFNEMIEDLQENDSDTDDTVLKLVQLTGRPAKFTDMGTFLGEIIPDGSTIKTALQALETAIEGLGASAFDLEISSITADQLVLNLTNDDYVIFNTATTDLAGLMSATDKQKLDWLSITGDINIHEIQVDDVVATSSEVTVENSNGTTVAFPIATGAQAGAITAFDKQKLNHISITQAVDLDVLEQRVADIEDFQVAPPIITPISELWNSTDTETTYIVDITPSDFKGFSIVYNRVLSGYESETYDAITVAGIEVVKAENVTKSYESAVNIVKGRDNQWYYTDHRGLSILIADSLTEELEVDVGTTNSAVIYQINFI